MTKPTSVNDKYNVNEDQVFQANGSSPARQGLLGNDSDADLNTFVVDRVKVGGTTTNIVGSTEFTSAKGSKVTLSTGGTFEYAPSAALQSLGRGETTTDSFEYRIKDSANEVSDFAQVEFTVAGRNDKPVAAADTATIDELGVAKVNVLANDSDVDTNDTFKIRNFQFVEFKKNGAKVSTNAAPTAADNLTINGFEQSDDIEGIGGTNDYTISIAENGDVVFTPGNSLKNQLSAGDVGEVTFRYRNIDDSGEPIADNATGDYTTLKVTINGLDPAPTVLGQAATLFVDANNNKVAGKGFFAGQDYDASGRFLFSNTDGSLNSNDAIKGTGGNDNIWAGLAGTDIIDAGEGDDIVGISNGTVDAGAGDDFVYSTREGGNLTASLGTGKNSLYSLADTSVATSGSNGGEFGYSDGNDTLTALSGDDFVYQINGQAQGGVKTLDLGNGNNTVFLGATESSSIITGNGSDSITIGNGRHTLNTGAGDDVVIIRGDAGDDLANLGAGNDYFGGGNSNDTINGGDGNDTILAGGGVDVLNGDGGNDILAGQGGNDFLSGGSGDDFLYGGAGNNELTGGTGNDVFALEKGIGGFQSITDFFFGGSTVTDKIGLTGGLQFESLQFTQLGTGAGGGADTDLLIASGGENLGIVRNINATTATQLQTQRAFYTAA